MHVSMQTAQLLIKCDLWNRLKKSFKSVIIDTNTIDLMRNKILAATIIHENKVKGGHKYGIFFKWRNT